MAFVLVVGQPLQSGFKQGFEVTINGGSFGPKSRAAGVILEDDGIDGPGVLSSQWDSHAMQTSNPSYTFYNKQNRALNFNPTGANVGAPHQGVSAIAANCHYGDSAPYQGHLGKVITVPGFPFCMRASWWQLLDPNWFGGASGFNIKQFAYGAQTGIQDCIYLGLSNAGGTGADSSLALLKPTTNDNDGHVSTIETTDRNGHTPNNVGFWTNSTNPFWVGPAGHGIWTYRQVEMCLDIVTGVGGVGYWKVRDNGNLIVNYAGRTDNFSSLSATTRGISIGASVYSGQAGLTAGFQNNWSYSAGHTIDISGSGVAGAVAGVILGDAPTYAACTKFQEQVCDVFTNTQIHIPKFKRGPINIGQTGYLHVKKENGSVIDSAASGVCS
jgi:hypothetical protein